MAALPIRYVFMVLAFIGMVFTFALKANLALVIVSMVNHTAFKQLENRTATNNASDDVLHALTRSENLEDNDDSGQDGPMLWSVSLQGIIISSYFWGYLCGQIPGARLAEDISAKWTFYVGVSTQIIGTLLTPPAAYIHYGAVIVIRVIEGVCGGFTFPCMHNLLTKWAPPSERSLMASVIYNGTSIGTVLSLLLTGTIAHHISWDAAFYILGAIGIPWMVLWPILISENPLKHKLMKDKEKELLSATLHLNVDRKSLKVPWKSIFLSGQVWILVICHMSTAWGFYMMLSELPLYMKMILKFRIDQNGMVTALPFVFMFLFSLCYGRLADYLVAKNKLSVRKVRNMSMIISGINPAICAIIIPFTQDRIFAVALMCIALACFGAVFSGFLQVHMELASNFAATLMSVTNTFATLIGIVLPIFAGWLIERDVSLLNVNIGLVFLTVSFIGGFQPSIVSWRILFWITAGCFAVQVIVFVPFARPKEQKWNNSSSSQENEEKT